MALLDKITLPPAPRQASSPMEYQRNVEAWARQAEQVIRQLERAIRALDDRTAPAA